MLHRDIYWLGRQWAVTGYGIQTVSKKHQMKFDVQASRIWADGLDESLKIQPWFDAEDFQQALAVARSKSRESPQTFQPPPGDEK